MVALDCRRAGLRVFCLAVALAVSPARAERSPSSSEWTPDAGITAEGGGDPRKPGFSPLVLRTRCDCVGGATLKLNGAVLRGKRLALSASLRRSPGTKSASIWIGVHGKQAAPLLAFATTFYQPIADDGSPTQRDVSLIVPWDAEVVELGVLASGSGEVKAEGVQMKVSDVRRSIRRADAVGEVEQAIRIVREHAWNASQLDERRLDEVREMARRARVPEEVQHANQHLLQGLGDHHSLLLPPKQASVFRDQVTPASEPEVSLREGRIGYVRIPAMTGANEQAARGIADDLMARIKVVSARGARGWIVDLRACSGGNMWPMLGGLAPLLGEGRVGFFRDHDGAQTEWLAGDHLGEPRLLPAVDLSGAKVAVLIGPETASSGEAVAVAFHGRPLTRFFGRRTYGASNSNQPFFLRDGSLMLLMTSVDVDRNGNVFGGKVVPDESGEGKPADEEMRDALRWLGLFATAP